MISPENRVKWVVGALAVLVIAGGVWLATRDTYSPDPSRPSGTTGGGLEETIPGVKPEDIPGPNGKASTKPGGGLPTAPGLPAMPEFDQKGFTGILSKGSKITLTITSDAPLAELCWSIPSSATSKKGCSDELTKPFSMTSVISGKAPYGFVVALSGPAGARTACTARLNGRVVSSNTVSGSWKWIYCGA